MTTPEKPAPSETKETDSSELCQPTSSEMLVGEATPTPREISDCTVLDSKVCPFEAPPFTESEIGELIANQRHMGTVYKIKKAAKIAKCKTSRILDYAGKGDIFLMSSFESGVDLIAFDWLSESAAVQRLNPELEKSMRPEMLVLDPKDCRQIDRIGEVDQSDFKNGYRFNTKGTAQICHPNSFAPELFKGGWVWRAFRQGKPSEIKISRDRLFLLHTELTKLIKLIEAEEKSEDKFQNNKPQEAAVLNYEIQTDELSTKHERTLPTTTAQESDPGVNTLTSTPIANAKPTSDEPAPSDVKEGVPNKQTNLVDKKLESQSTAEPWLVVDPNDPKPGHFQPWYIPARYFAREIVKADPAMKSQRKVYVSQIMNTLAEKNIFKRGGKSPPSEVAILKALQNVKF